MYKFTCLRCYNCNSVIINLPESEVEKLNGLTFQCECCDYLNLLSNSRFIEAAKENLKSICSFS
ncbi:hypothetical protein DFR58_105175 [Anaerobacterium chartisolvens]|uniref:Cysteine-rich KTR protein n=1 Tax=Anaerobacterium chartisolvens TaxID=1297424 RepID=A0A369BAH8_9FIRM|nr:hypothetical protein [Anaerobacterium chartisolvens]RCX18411.1 hypothetical protein DFR58_105175 [Anaerobacterium chartisolvens]